MRRHDRIGLAGFDPCAILLNNDLSAGIPAILRDIEGQVLVPPLHAGWAVRRKSNHFYAYDEVAADFAAMLGIDPWFVNPFFCAAARSTSRRSPARSACAPMSTRC